MKVQKKYVVNSDMQDRVLFKGNNIPTWYENYDDISSWYNSSTAPPDYAFFYNTVDDDVFIQYGKDASGWASGRFFGQTVKILDEEEHANGDLSVTVEVTANFFVGRQNSIVQTGHPVIYNVKVNNKIQYNRTGNTVDNFTLGKREKQTFSVRIKPQETSTLTALLFEIKYPTGIFDDREIIIGIGLYNPNPPTYIPMATRKNGKWKDLNTNKGKILIRKGSNWIDKSEENVNTSKEENKGKNRIRKNGKWLQLPPMKNGTT